MLNFCVAKRRRLDMIYRHKLLLRPMALRFSGTAKKSERSLVIHLRKSEHCSRVRTLRRRDGPTILMLTRAHATTMDKHFLIILSNGREL
ncbi:hypothetical protein A0H81_10801 [Grifola frondosa]|uniref:Uncharacterized protein n=1 Tax=Grifola frondosa TaxID=5627 RepID=A0A1C7M2B8_GRIFR|nr:hypothetical protein A0H81_10801 [Grifola frondosa]